VARLTGAGGAFRPMPAGGDSLALVAFFPIQLNEHHFTHYVLLSRYWWWERAQLLGALGPGVIAIFLMGGASLWRGRKRRSPERAAGFVGAAGALCFVGLWGFDWGLVGDWNMAAPWLLAAALFLLPAARGAMRRMPLSLCALLAAGLALPGLALTVSHRLASPWDHMPDPARWERTTGRGRTLCLAAAHPSWQWRTLRKEVELPAPGAVRIALTPLRHSPGLVDRLEWVDAASGRTVAWAEAEDLAPVRYHDGKAAEDWTMDGKWGAAPAQSASGGMAAEIFRVESPGVALEWLARLPAGRYRPRVRVFESTWFPVGYVPVLRWEVDLAGAE